MRQNGENAPRCPKPAKAPPGAPSESHAGLMSPRKPSRVPGLCPHPQAQAGPTHVSA